MELENISALRLPGRREHGAVTSRGQRSQKEREATEGSLDTQRKCCFSADGGWTPRVCAEEERRLLGRPQLAVCREPTSSSSCAAVPEGPVRRESRRRPPAAAPGLTLPHGHGEGARAAQPLGVRHGHTGAVGTRPERLRGGYDPIATVHLPGAVAAVEQGGKQQTERARCSDYGRNGIHVLIKAPILQLKHGLQGVLR